MNLMKFTSITFYLSFTLQPYYTTTAFAPTRLLLHYTTSTSNSHKTPKRKCFDFRVNSTNEEQTTEGATTLTSFEISSATESNINTLIDDDTTKFTNNDTIAKNNDLNNENPNALSIILLNLIAIIWGTQHSFIKMVVEDSNASVFSFVRFAIAFLISSPYTPSIIPFINYLNGNINASVKNELSSSSFMSNNDRKSEDVQSGDDEEIIMAWRWGLEMGLWMFLGYAFQAFGLTLTTAQRSGFLLYLNVKLVPFFARIFYGRNISISTWASAFVAFCGTALLSLEGGTIIDGTKTAYNFNMSYGDLWSILAAAASAMFILRLESASKAVPNSSMLNSVSLLVVTFTSFLWCIGDEILSHSKVTSSTSILLSTSWDDNPTTTILDSLISNISQVITTHPFELIYLGGISTALANYIQTKAQRGISAERASIIYALDPVYGAFFSNLILGETLSTFGMIGASLITLAAVTNSLLDFGSPKLEESKDQG